MVRCSRGSMVVACNYTVTGLALCERGDCAKLPLMMTRRRLVFGGAAGLAAAVLGVPACATAKGDDTFEVTHTDAEWRKLLTPAQYAVLRKEATEPPGTSELLHEKRHGDFACAGCDLE